VRRGEVALAAGYLTSVGVMGLLQPYWSTHLSALGYPATLIGVLLGLVNAMRLFAPLMISGVGDRTADRRPLVLAFAAASALAGLVLALAVGPMTMALGISAFGGCFYAFMALYDAHTVDWLAEQRARYGRLRLWGSLGFVVVSVLTGRLIERFGDPVIPAMLAAILLLTALVVWGVPATPHRPVDPARRSIALVDVLVEPRLRRFLWVCFLQLAGFGGYYGFYTLYLSAYGYSTSTIGGFWALAVIAEIGLFLVVPLLMARVALASLLRVSLALTVLRWVIVAALPDWAGVQAAAQLLHLAGFALFHSVTVLMCPRLLPPGSGTRAQALVSSLGWGAGGIAGSVVSGALWSTVGPRAVFMASALITLVAFVLSLDRRLTSVDGGAVASAAAR
jgi:PPP family 3-phenylpropionic acid transporter